MVKLIIGMILVMGILACGCVDIPTGINFEYEEEPVVEEIEEIEKPVIKEIDKKWSYSILEESEFYNQDGTVEVNLKQKPNDENTFRLANDEDFEFDFWINATPDPIIYDLAIGTSTERPSRVMFGDPINVNVTIYQYYENNTIEKTYEIVNGDGAFTRYVLLELKIEDNYSKRFKLKFEDTEKSLHDRDKLCIGVGAMHGIYRDIWNGKYIDIKVYTENSLEEYYVNLQKHEDCINEMIKLYDDSMEIKNLRFDNEKDYLEINNKYKIYEREIIIIPNEIQQKFIKKSYIKSNYDDTVVIGDNLISKTKEYKAYLFVNESIAQEIGGNINGTITLDDFNRGIK